MSQVRHFIPQLAPGIKPLAFIDFAPASDYAERPLCGGADRRDFIQEQ
ncbi:MAG: hypothetical protein OXC70_01465 [Gammaproteobacteria bacterium]|nr:hypothetical protein [Gammaproteobacteria bacterium]